MGSARTTSKVGEVTEDRKGERQRGRIWSGAVRWHGDKGRMTSWKPKVRASKGVACKTSRSRGAVGKAREEMGSLETLGKAVSVGILSLLIDVHSLGRGLLSTY